MRQALGRTASAPGARSAGGRGLNLEKHGERDTAEDTISGWKVGRQRVGNAFGVRFGGSITAFDLEVPFFGGNLQSRPRPCTRQLQSRQRCPAAGPFPTAMLPRCGHVGNIGTGRTVNDLLRCSVSSRYGSTERLQGALVNWQLRLLFRIGALQHRPDKTPE